MMYIYICLWWWSTVVSVVQMFITGFHNNYSYWKVCLYVVQYTNSYGKIDRYDRYISIYMLYMWYIYIYIYIYTYICMYIYILYRKSLQIWYTQLVGHGCEHEAPQSSGRRSSSFQLLSALLNVWQVIFTKVKCFLSLAHCMWLKPKKYIGTQPK